LYQPSWIGNTVSVRTILLIITVWLVGTMDLPAPLHDEENATPPAKEPVRQKSKHSAERNQTDAAATESKSSEAKPKTDRPSGKARNLSGPSPQYPAEATGQHLTGTGQYVLHFDQKTGLVTDVTVLQSTGSALLDEAAIKAFRQWHEDPNCAKDVTMTMSFTVQQATPR
jgi:TonB family protein